MKVLKNKLFHYSLVAGKQLIKINGSSFYENFTFKFFKKSAAILLAFVFIFTSLAVSPVKTYAAEASTVKVSDSATSRSRIIISSDSVVDHRNSYRSANFTTASSNTRIHHSMSYYISCSSANVTFDIEVYRSNGTFYTKQNLSANNPLASAVFYLEGNTTYYFKVIPSKNDVKYDFAYNIYYDK